MTTVSGAVERWSYAGPGPCEVRQKWGLFSVWWLKVGQLYLARRAATQSFVTAGLEVLTVEVTYVNFW